MGKAIMLSKTTFLAVLLLGLYAVPLVLPQASSFAGLKSPRRGALRMMAVKVSR